jgi:hypothetical protein
MFMKLTPRVNIEIDKVSEKTKIDKVRKKIEEKVKKILLNLKNCKVKTNICSRTNLDKHRFTKMPLFLTLSNLLINGVRTQK